MTTQNINILRNNLVDIIKFRLNDLKSAKPTTPVNIFGAPLTKIKSCLSPEDISKLLRYSYEDLSKIIYPSTSKSYRHFSIPKKSGTERSIDAPKKALKAIQRNLVSEITKYFQPRPSAHGFISERSIVSNALAHVNKTFVFNIDLDNFFGTIHFGRVKNLFMSHPFNRSHAVATVLAQICCNKGCLPQGAPTSPIISNMICHKLDRNLQSLARKYQCTYTRYADDITFSFTTSKRKLPYEIVCINKINDPDVGSLLKKIINDNGFKVNPRKTRLKYRSQKQEVTGLVVNEKVNVKRSFIRQTSSMLYAWKTFGSVNAEKDYLDKYRTKKLMARHQLKANSGDGGFFIKVVKGRINFIKMVKGDDDPVYKKLAYQLTELFGSPNSKYIKTKEQIATDSIFILENNLDISQGTAFSLERIGIITNCHVVKSIDSTMASQLELFRHNESTVVRKVTFDKSDFDKDLAIFKPLSNFSDIKPLPIGDDSKIQTGYEVIVIGFPQHSVGAEAFIGPAKVVQSRMHLGRKLWIIDTPIVHGNSGGPIFNKEMEVIGIATAGPETNSGETIFNGFIPISDLVDFASSS